MKKLLSFMLCLSLLAVLPAFARESDELSKDGWSITADSQIRPAENAIDDNPDTIWHSSYEAEGSTITKQDTPPFTLEITLPAATVISGVRYYPRTDGSNAGIATAAAIEVSENGTDFVSLGAVGYTEGVSDRTPRTTVFSENVKVKKVRYILQEGVSNFGTCAELSLLAEDKSKKTGSTSSVTLTGGKKIEIPEKATDEVPVGNWTVTASSVKIKADNMIDGKTNTPWHSNYEAEGSTITSQDNPPFTLEFQFGADTEISGIRYYPRTDGSLAGNVIAAELYLSADGKTFAKAGDVAYEDDTDTHPRTTTLSGNVKVRAVRYIITAARSNFGTCGEMAFLTKNDGLSSASVDTVKVAKTTVEGGGEQAAPATPAAPADTGSHEKGDYAAPKEGMSYEVDELVPQATWYAWASSSMGSPALALDGDQMTWWHSHYTAESGTITGHDNVPYEFIITFPEPTAISGLRYYPRPEGQSTTGIFHQADVYVSDDGETFYPALTGYECHYGVQGDGERTPVDMTFAANVRAKAVKLVVTNTTQGYAVASEIRALAPDPHHAATVTATEFNKRYEEEFHLVSLDKTGVTVTPSSEQPQVGANENDLGLLATKTLDDNRLSGWHTHYMDENGMTGERVMPAFLSYDLGRTCTLRAISYVPRGGGFRSGHWIKLSVSASDDGEHYDLIDNYEVTPTQYCAFGETVFYFKDPVTTRFLRIDITSTASDAGKVSDTHASANEVYFYESAADALRRQTAEQECYKLVIGQKEIEVTKNGEKKTVTIDVAPFIVNGTTMLPLRGLFEEMGAVITWVPENKKILVSGDTDMEFQVENNRVFVGGIRYTCIVAPRIVESRTFIPLRFISEHMGYKVSWDGATQTITIEK